MRFKVCYICDVDPNAIVWRIVNRIRMAYSHFDALTVLSSAAELSRAGLIWIIDQRNVMQMKRFELKIYCHDLIVIKHSRQHWAFINWIDLFDNRLPCICLLLFIDCRSAGWLAGWCHVQMRFVTISWAVFWSDARKQMHTTSIHSGNACSERSSKSLSTFTGSLCPHPRRTTSFDEFSAFFEQNFERCSVWIFQLITKMMERVTDDRIHCMCLRTFAFY